MDKNINIIKCIGGKIIFADNHIHCFCLIKTQYSGYSNDGVNCQHIIFNNNNDINVNNNTKIYDDAGPGYNNFYYDLIHLKSSNKLLFIGGQSYIYILQNKFIIPFKLLS